MTAPAKVKVPGVGPTDRRLVIAGAVAGIGIGGLYYYKQRQNSSATPPASQIDPATGEVYGSTADAAALAAQGNYVQAGNVGGTSDAAPGPQQPPAFTSNSGWSQAAHDYLVNVGGGDPGVIGTALGLYITGQPLSDAQKQIIDSAIAFEGYPPVAGSNGFPPATRDAAPIPVPIHATPLPTPQLRVVNENKQKTQAVIRWTAVPGAVFYRLTGSRPPIYATGTQTTVAGHGGRWGYHVYAYPAGYSHDGFRTDPHSIHTVSAASNSVHV